MDKIQKLMRLLDSLPLIDDDGAQQKVMEQVYDLAEWLENEQDTGELSLPDGRWIALTEDTVTMLFLSFEVGSDDGEIVKYELKPVEIQEAT